MNSLLLLIEGDDELRPVVKGLQAKSLNGSCGPYRGILSNGKEIIAMTTGVGPKQAYQVTAQAIRQFNPEYVISAGTCGALVPGLNISDWVVTGNVRAIGEASKRDSTLECLLNQNGVSVRQLCRALGDTPRWQEGRLVTVADEPVIDRGDKEVIAKAHEAIAVDMESYGIAKAAIDGNVPWLVARVVVDTLDTPLPELGPMNLLTGRPPLSGIAKYVLKNPLSGPQKLYSLWALVQVYAGHLVRILPKFTAQASNRKECVTGRGERI